MEKAIGRARVLAAAFLALIAAATSQGGVDPAEIAKADAVTTNAAATPARKLAALRNLASACSQARDAEAMEAATRRILGLDVEAAAKGRACNDVGALYNHVLRHRSDAAAWYHRANGYFREAAGAAEGIDRARALEPVRANFRQQTCETAEADAVAVEMLGLYREALPAQGGIDRVRTLDQIGRLLADLRRGDEAVAVRAETLEAVKAAFAEARETSDAEWLAKGDPWLMMSAAAAASAGIATALEIADRVAAIDVAVPGAVQARRRLWQVALAYARASADETSRAKGAAYVKAALDVAATPADRANLGIAYAETLFRVSRDLEGARRAIADVLSDAATPPAQRETAELWRDMLSD